MSKPLKIAFVGLGLCVVIYGLVFPILAHPREQARRDSCQQNLKNIYTAMALYTNDSRGRFPVARTGWATALQPNLRTENLGCPSDAHPPVAIVKARHTGLYNAYWFNANLSAVSKSTLSYPHSTLLMGEGNDGTDVKDETYCKTTLPVEWLNDSSKPCWRHLNGANYLYTDGHVQWLRPSQVTSNFGRTNCFAVR